jgi:hypothetical protein
MKHIKKTFLFCLFSIVVHAQTGIGTASPDSSAKLEVASNSKGILTPRMTSSQRTAIVNPANGLLVYQTDGVVGFYVNSGTSGTPAWTRVNSDWVKSGNDISYSGGNVSISGDQTTTGSVTASSFIGNGSQLSSVLTKVNGSWVLAPGSNSISITVAPGGTYSMWVYGNIPNGIAMWNATVTTANTNVPVVGSQYAWYYAAGNALVFSSIPDQIIGSNNTILSSPQGYAPNTSNIFRFGITNNSGSNQTIYWGYSRLD